MKVLESVLFSIVLVVASFQIASSFCCEDIKSEVEEKELAHNKLCSNVSSGLDKCCEDLGMDVKKQRKAYETLCPVINQFHAKFTNLGATGRLGPRSLGSHYVGKDHEKMVTVNNGIQSWTVPDTGTYEITAVGAAGGYDKPGLQSARGRGAYMKGEFALSKGDAVKILVGQEGVQNTASQSSGGGGGSFVATSSNIPLVVAGGGGGMENLKTRLANCDASTGTSGKKNQCKASCAIWPGGVSGNGALKADSSNSGGGGGGFRSNGRSSTQFGGAYGSGGEGGRGFIQGGAGGRARSNNAVGGFGGGGGAYGAGGGAGGGGGYSGGASGNNDNDSCGGGAGSYNIGKNQVKKEGFRANGHGYVEIRRQA